MSVNFITIFIKTLIGLVLQDKGEEGKEKNFEYTYRGIRIVKGNHFAYNVCKCFRVEVVPPVFARIFARQPHKTFTGKENRCKACAVPQLYGEQPPEISLGNGKIGGRDEPSQKTCL